MATRITTHVADALDRLPYQHKDKTKIRGLISSVVSPFQTLEDSWYQLLTERQIDTAVGAQLDLIGAIVGEPRAGKVDADYRRYLRARVATNASDGLAEEILNIARLVVGDDTITYRLTSYPTATYVLRLDDGAVSDDIATALAIFLRLATSAGIRGILEWSPYDRSTIFKWDTVDQGWDEGVWTGALE